MSGLTLNERINAEAERARLQAAEKFYFDQAQPFFPDGFSIYRRNPGHWDISAAQCPGKVAAFLEANPGSSTTARDGGTERAFRIRGEPGAVVVIDERWDPHRPHPREPSKFRSVTAAMLWIAEELMQEPDQKGASDGPLP